MKPTPDCSEQLFLLGGTSLIVVAIAALSVNTVWLHRSNRQMYVDLQVQAQHFRDWERHSSNLSRAEQYYQARDYEECIRIVQTIPETSPIYAQARVLSADCHTEVGAVWLEEAVDWANQGQFLRAVQVASQITSGEDYLVAQRHLRVWTRHLIAVATHRHEAATDETARLAALNILSQIPAASPYHHQAIALGNQWRQQEINQQRAWDLAQRALAVDNLDLAQQTAQTALQAATVGSARWRDRWSDLEAQLVNRRAQYEGWREAAERHLAQGDGASALALAQKLPDYAPWADPKASIMAQVKALHRADAAAEGRRLAQESLRLLVATLGGGGFGFLGGVTRR